MGTADLAPPSIATAVVAVSLTLSAKSAVTATTAQIPNDNPGEKVAQQYNVLFIDGYDYFSLDLVKPREWWEKTTHSNHVRFTVENHRGEATAAAAAAAKSTKKGDKPFERRFDSKQGVSTGSGGVSPNFEKVVRRSVKCNPVSSPVQGLVLRLPG